MIPVLLVLRRTALCCLNLAAYCHFWCTRLPHWTSRRCLFQKVPLQKGMGVSYLLLASCLSYPGAAHVRLDTINWAVQSQGQAPRKTESSRFPSASLRETRLQSALAASQHWQDTPHHFKMTSDIPEFDNVSTLCAARPHSFHRSSVISLSPTERSHSGPQGFPASLGLGVIVFMTLKHGLVWELWNDQSQNTV